MSKKGNNVIGILVIILIILTIGGFFAYYNIKNGETKGYFKKEEVSVAQPLYDKIMALNEEEYPKTPEEVVILFTDVSKLIYGDKIKDMSIVSSILEKQRLLLSNDLVDTNSLQEQTENVLAIIENLNANKVKITSIDVKPTVYDQKNNSKSYVKVDTKDSLFQTYYQIYYLELEGDKWKITGWYNTDENYNVI